MIHRPHPLAKNCPYAYGNHSLHRTEQHVCSVSKAESKVPGCVTYHLGANIRLCNYPSVSSAIRICWFEISGALWYNAWATPPAVTQRVLGYLFYKHLGVSEQIDRVLTYWSDLVSQKFTAYSTSKCVFLQVVGRQQGILNLTSDMYFQSSLRTRYQLSLPKTECSTMLIDSLLHFNKYYSSVLIETCLYHFFNAKRNRTGIIVSNFSERQTSERNTRAHARFGDTCVMLVSREACILPAPSFSPKLENTCTQE